MITRVDDKLRAEAERFGLRFTCRHCAHFEVERRACSSGYPSEPHEHVDLRVAREMSFCKGFELT